ncbi:MAG: TRAP transporter large permease [Flavobacteriales bacterium]|nr:TRAP transporter large permease [Flavobacteriales bacterium]MDW8432835.1 TRAP transporter large permease [Flavobacteriales bacterium]
MTLGLVVLLLLVLVLIGAPLFLVIGAVSLGLFWMGNDVELFSLTKTMFDSLNKPALLSIPLYVFAGALMSRGEIAKRLIDLAMAALGWVRGGLAAGAVMACVLFAAISGSSPVTLIAIGTIMYPAMIQKGYPDKMALGVLTVSGSLGILIPPSIPMIIFSIVTGTDVNKLFIAGIVPGILTALLIILLALFLGLRLEISTQPFSAKNLVTAFWRGIPALLLPVLILGGIYSGIYNVTEAAAVGAVYAIGVEMLFFKSLKIKDIGDTLHDSVMVMGTIFIIIAMATVFNYYLVLQEAPFWLLENLEKFITSQTMFLLVTMGILLVVGLFMDSISAVLILAPLLLPTALLYEVDPIHLGIVFILGLEIGYLTPPVGVNLFVSAGVFNKPFGRVVVAALPYLLMVLLALIIVAFVPELTFLLISGSDSPAAGTE